jgi:hypothetical protein
MRTTLNIEDNLIRKVSKLTGIKEKTTLVKLGLEALIAKESAKRLAKLGGTEKELKMIPRRRIAEVGYRRFVRDGIGAGSIWNRKRVQSVLGGRDFIESLNDYVKGRKRIPEIAKSQRFMNKPPLREILGLEVLRDKRKRNKSIREAVFGHGYTQREVADYLRIHFTSVSRILRANGKMLRK